MVACAPVSVLWAVRAAPKGQQERASSRLRCFEAVFELLRAVGATAPPNPTPPTSASGARARGACWG
eukprot:420667-Alexandrium_andersonii.AAC.1